MEIESYKTPIFKAVAYPPTLFFCPMEIAGVNFALNIVLMLLGIAKLNIPPPVWIISLFSIHIFFSIRTASDPHLALIGQASGRFLKKQPNLIKESLVKTKYVP